MKFLPMAYLLAYLLFFAAGCGFLESANDAVLVRVSNETEINFTEVVLDLGSDETSHAVFQDVAPGSATGFTEVEEGYSQPFTIRAYSESGEFVFDAVAVIAILLEPGRYTYVLKIHTSGNLFVDGPRANSPRMR